MLTPRTRDLRLSTASSPGSFFARILRPVLDLVCPPHCAACGEPLADGSTMICDYCADRLATSDGRFCTRCFGRRYAAMEDEFGCPRCATTVFRFRKLIALGEYEMELRHAILRAKSDRAGYLATALAALTVERRRNLLTEIPIDWIVPVPMHSKRRRERGVNNPDFLAEEIARRLRKPIAHGLVVRERRTELQHRMSTAMRSENVRGAFTVPDGKRKKLLAGKNILLVDDILTTASTCNELAGVLRNAGAASVSVCVIARSEGSAYRPESEQITVDR